MTQLFHVEVGIPEALKASLPYPRLRYGRHAQQAAVDEGLRTLPSVLPKAIKVVEVEVTNGKASKWVIRTQIDPQRDLVLVVVADGFVKTVWCNRVSDQHKTLKRHLYTSPQAFKA